MAKKMNRRTRKQRGGGWAFTGATISGVNNYGQVNTPIGDCRAAPPPGFISSMAAFQKGLPGLSGGSRKRRNNLNQMGGRYGFDLANPVPGAAAPWAGGIPQVQRIACEGSTPNPLNPGPHTPSTAPPAPSGNSLLAGGRRNTRRNRRQGGGGGLGTDNLAYYAPTAGYDNQASRWVDSVGAPVLLQKPYDGQAWNPACVKTGGKRRNRKVNRKKTHRRNRK